MDGAAFRILQLVSSKRITVLEGGRLLDALRQGYPEDFRDGFRAEASPSSQASDHSFHDKVDEHDAGKGRDAIGTGTSLETGLEPTIEVVSAPSATLGPNHQDVRAQPEDSAAKEAKEIGEPVQTAPDGNHDAAPSSRPQDQAVVLGMLKPGDLIAIPPGVSLEIEHIPQSSTHIDNTVSVSIRGIDSRYLQVGQGSEARMRLEGPTYTLTWEAGPLLLEVPNHLARLTVRGIPGSVHMMEYSGPFIIESLEGELEISGASGPFQIKNVQGPLRLFDLALKEGSSSIVGTEADIEIQMAASASVAARVWTEDGAVSFGDDRDDSPGIRRRGSWRFGSGRAELAVSTTRGRVRVYQEPAGRERSDGQAS